MSQSDEECQVDQTRADQTRADQTPSEPPYLQVREAETQVIRFCAHCSGQRKAVACRRESSPWLLHDRFVTWRCEDCQDDMDLLSGETVVLRLTVLAGIVALISWLGLSGGLSALFEVFTKWSWTLLPAAVAVMLLLSAVLTAWHILIELVHDLDLRRENPRTAGPSGWGRLGQTLALGLIPWLLAGGLYLFYQHVYRLKEIIVFLMLPLIFSPIFLANRLSLSQMGTFLATLFWLALIALIMFYAPIAQASQEGGETGRYPLWIHSQDQGCIKVDVELAADRAAKTKGLMQRTSLGENQGMLFLWNLPHRVRMWMNQTLIPLDMWFIDEQGRVVQIEERQDTESKRVSQSRQPVSMVLELQAGFARSRGLTTESDLTVAMDPDQREQWSEGLSESMNRYLASATVHCPNPAR